MPGHPNLFEIGERVPGTKWVVQAKLGEGGMGVVYGVVKEPGIEGAMKVRHRADSARARIRRGRRQRLGGYVTHSPATNRLGIWVADSASTKRGRDRVASGADPDGWRGAAGARATVCRPTGSTW